MCAQKKEQLNSDLLRYSTLGDVKRLETALEGGADVNTVGINFGSTPLHMATARGKTGAMRILMANPLTEVNTKDTLRGSTPLHLAAEIGDTEGMGILLADTRTDVNITDNFGNRTPLHIAAGKGEIEAIKLLIAAGADTTIKGSDNKLFSDFLNEEQNAEISDFIESTITTAMTTAISDMLGKLSPFTVNGKKMGTLPKEIAGIMLGHLSVTALPNIQDAADTQTQTVKIHLNTLKVAQALRDTAKETDGINR